jgi:hypothetical protein
MTAFAGLAVVDGLTEHHFGARTARASPGKGHEVGPRRRGGPAHCGAIVTQGIPSM